MDREPGGLQSMGLGRDRCDLATNQQHASSILLTSAETLVFSNGATLEMYNWCVIHWDLEIDLLPQVSLAVSNENEDDFTWTSVEVWVGVRIYYAFV